MPVLASYLRVRLDQAVLVGKDNGLHAVPQVQLRKDASDVGLHGGFRDDEVRRRSPRSTYLAQAGGTPPAHER